MKKHMTAIHIASYLLAVTLIFSGISLLCNVDTVEVHPAQDGIADLTEINFEESVAAISTEAAFIYDGAFYTSEDFAGGNVTQQQQGERAKDTNWILGDYGTIRFVLKLPAGRAYTLSAKSAAYAQRLFINGEEYTPIGVTGDSAASVVPKTTRYTEAFYPASDTTEIILHYSNFVHPDGGSIYTLKLGLANNISRVEQLRTFQVVIVTGALLTAMLFFLGIFLFFPKDNYLLWFSLVCGCIALRSLLVGDKLGMLLVPDLGWYVDIRLKYLLTDGLIVFSAMYLKALFPGTVHRWAARGFMIFCIGNAVLYVITPPIIFARFVWFSLAVSIGYFIYAVINIIKAAICKDNPKMLSVSEQLLLLPGFCVYLLLVGYEIYAHENALYLWGLDFAQIGMLIFLFLNILALLLQFSRIRQELSKALESEREMEETNRMLERLDTLKTDFLSNISHEMRTPLMVMSGYAQLTSWQIAAGTADDDTQANLRVVSREAQRLAELAAGLLRVSADPALELDAVSLQIIFKRIDVTCRPILKKNGNRLEIQFEESLPPVQANEDMIFQVLLNLIVNANRHTQNGVICLRAGLGGEDYISVTVEDDGEGIRTDLLDRIFDRHVSGDGGSGIGLSICRDVVEEHGGRIDAENRPGGGARIIFTLPLGRKGKEEAADESDYFAN